MKFRIVEYTHHVDQLRVKNGNSRMEYVIQRKTWLGWKEITSKELTSKRISHKTYKDAEAYMMMTYMGHGECRKVGTEYTYTAYQYYYY